MNIRSHKLDVLLLWFKFHLQNVEDFILNQFKIKPKLGDLSRFYKGGFVLG